MKQSGVVEIQPTCDGEGKMKQPLPTYFLGHGGGPWPWVKDNFPGWFDELDRFLKSLPAHLPEKPKAILVISGHWQKSEFAVMANPWPPMIYDFGGFPEWTYDIQYPAPGHPVLATEIQRLLAAAGIEATLDHHRGFDHGTYSMLYPMFPKADVPVLQLSLKNSYDPVIHILAGRALAPLRRLGVLIIGSGSSYHDPHLPGVAKEQSLRFDQWLQDVLVKSTGRERNRKLTHWALGPAARNAHPEEDHLIPLMVAVGAAENEVGSLIYHEMFMDRFAISSFRFG